MPSDRPDGQPELWHYDAYEGKSRELIALIKQQVKERREEQKKKQAANGGVRKPW